MTDAERELLRGLIAAAWPFPAQVTFGVAIMAGYWLWSRFYFAALDPVLRRWLGARLGDRVVWVYRDTGLGLRTRRHRWTWGVDGHASRSDVVAWLLSFVVVTLAGGLWPVAVFLYVSLEWKALSYVVFFPVCLAVVALYGVFWAGRYEVGGMR